MEGLPFFIFIAFIVVSILEKVLLKKPRSGGTGQRPGQRMPPQPRPEVRTRIETHTRRLPEPTLPESTSSGRADEMIPEDLWMILTGESRPTRVPAPAPAPLPDLPSWDEDAIAQIEAEADEETSEPEARSLEEYRRPRLVREEPRIVSLETAPLPPERRHAAFHERLASDVAAQAARAAAAPSTADVRARTGMSAGALRTRLRSAQHVRDALVLNEVLGKPKSLD